MSDAGESVTFESDGLTLEGRLHLPDGQSTAADFGDLSRAVAVCHPHPLYGGDMNNNVVLALCRALAAGGLAALRFNFRGVSGSQGSHSGGPGERQDTVAALDYLNSRRYRPLALAGYSFGAAVALAAASDPRVSAVAAVSLPVGFAHPPSQEGFAGGYPVLLVTGTRDDFAPADGVRAFGKELGKGCRVEVIEGADHFWWGYEHALAETVVSFLKRALA